MSKKMSVLEILKAARKLITPRKRWIKKDYARTSPRGNMTSATGEDATCWCMVGAVQKVSDSQRSEWIACDFLIKVTGGNVTKFNDNHTHEQVLAAFDKVIAKEEANVAH